MVHKLRYVVDVRGGVVLESHLSSRCSCRWGRNYVSSASPKEKHTLLAAAVTFILFAKRAYLWGCCRFSEICCTPHTHGSCSAQAEGRTAVAEGDDGRLLEKTS